MRIITPSIKRHLAKTFTWRMIGTVDTMFLGWFISGNAVIGLKIGGLELITKMILYFLHERVWYSFPSRGGYKRSMVFSSDTANLTPELFGVSRQQKEHLNRHRTFVLWLTGLSAAGKSTIARHLEEQLHASGIRTLVLDGDNTRMGINKDLDFSPEGRHENIRRVAEIARLMNDAGVVVIASFISPLQQDRQMARNIIGEDSFIEVFIDASLDTCIRRDPKGLYQKAIDGHIREFTGINAPYDIPQQPDIHVRTDRSTPQSASGRIIRWLSENHLTDHPAILRKKSMIPAEEET